MLSTRQNVLRFFRHQGCLCLVLLLAFFSSRIVADETTSESLTVSGKPETPPNILLVLVDDLGFSDLGCYGGEIETPHLDALAKSGVRFNQFYNTSRCWPTRSSLLSGYYAQQILRDQLFGLPTGGAQQSRPEWATLLPEILAPAGYRSYHTGKWHIDGLPKDAGFLNPQWTQTPHGQFVSGKDGDRRCLSTAMANHAIQALDQHAKQYANSPFFQYLAFTAPHFPLQALPEDIEHYRGRYDAGWDAIRQQRLERMQKQRVMAPKEQVILSAVERDLGAPYHFPDAFQKLGPGEIDRPLPWNQLTPEQQKFQAAKMEIHAAMVHRVDIELGRVIKKIRDLGKFENTVILFLSDNGASAEIMVRDKGHDSAAPMGSETTYLCLGPGWSTVCNTPFRRHKTWTHEGGITTPLIVSWPGRIGSPGKAIDPVGHVIDVVPTLLEIAGASETPSPVPRPGKSFAKLLTNADASQADDESDERTLWWFHDGHRAIRVGDYKAVAPIEEPWQLYDLAQDRTEQHDLAIIETDRLESMAALWQQMAQDFSEVATKNLPKQKREALKKKQRPSGMSQAQQAALPKRSQVLLGGENLRVKDRHAFLIAAKSSAKQGERPWIFYAPTLPAYPDQHESKMLTQFIEAGISIAGIDVGEAYGSPHALKYFDALYAEMKSRGYNDRHVLLGRSRGGLWVTSWAIAYPERVAAIAGIYPVFDFTTYPKIDRAAPAYGMSPQLLTQQLSKFNPIAGASAIAEKRVPMFLIHGEEDVVVPIAENSAAMESTYQRAGASDVLTLLRIPDQGHNFWPGFFQCQELIDFVIAQSAKTKKPASR
jgi:arylsulfatase A-like enzyme/pimeloyl-ACP methyl ester carboxylesterase